MRWYVLAIHWTADKKAHNSSIINMLFHVVNNIKNLTGHY